MFIRELYISLKDNIKTKEPNKMSIGYVNISHIPIDVLQKVFEVDIQEDQFVRETYFLKEHLYKKYKKHFKLGIQFHFDLFDYSISLGSNVNVNKYFLHSRDLGYSSVVRYKGIEM